MYFRPRTLHEAVDTLAHHGGRILAGGTDFYPSLGEQVPRMPIVDVSAIAELRGVSVLSEYYSIGGLTTWSELLRAPLPTSFDALKAAAREVGSVQIQNRGTVAGNLCNASPAADGVPPLLALNAEVELTSQAGVRRLPLSNFILGNRKTALQSNEMLTRILVPRELENASSAFLKLGSRRYLVISIVMVAVVLQVDGGRVTHARIAVGSCSVVARRLFELEQSLAGQIAGPGLSKLVRADHLAGLSPIDDVRAGAAYRRDAALTLVQRGIAACAGGH